MKEFYTVYKTTEVSFEEKKSIFICNIKRIADEKEAMEFVNSIKLKYKDATHNVYAYITNNTISMRYSDDGEPQGTAGPPVLEVLKREGLNDVVAVITRYFGGTLLGAGGLVRAYSASCKMGIDNAKKTKLSKVIEFSLNCDYDRYGKINNYFQSKNIIINNVDFTDKVIMTITCLASEFDNFNSEIIDMMSGDNIIKVEGENLAFVDDEYKLMEVL